MLRHGQGGVINEQMIANSVETVSVSKLHGFDAFPACAHFVEEDAETQFLRGFYRLA